MKTCSIRDLRLAISGFRFRARGFTLVQIIAVLALMAILVTAAVPSVIRRVDQAARTRETTDLNTIADSYTQYVLRNKKVPGTNDWPTAIAGHMSLPVSAITTNSRRYARAFLIDPNLRINGAGLPYTQTSNLGASSITNARVMILSSLAGALPISTSVPSSNEFNAIWNTAEGSKPSTWTNWPGFGDDLRIKRFNLEPFFHQLILVNKDASKTPNFSIDGTNTTSLAASALGWNKYYLDGSVVGLCDSNTNLQSRHLLKRSTSFRFESGSWSGQGPGGQSPGGVTGSDFLNSAITFFNQRVNPATQQGATQYAVLIAMYTFMFDYTLWANECPHFNRHGDKSGSASSIPEYILLNNQGQNGQGNLDKFSGDLITRP
jgi:type II secretory pathway pseudopilin PulG